MNLPSSKALDFYQINLIKKRSRLDEREGDTTPDYIAMNPFHEATSSRHQLQSDNEIEAPSIAERRCPSRIQRMTRKTKIVLRRHLSFVGPGIVASVAYMDPGNWVTDLAAGAQFGYALNFVILLSGLFGIFLQILAVRLGTVTGEDLARNTRLLCLPEGPDGEPLKDIRWRKCRIALLVLAYVVAEGALIATELAELIGSAIAINLLFPQVPVWGGVLITTLDVLLILLVYKPRGNTRVLEYLIGCLVFIVIACYIALLVKVEPRWGLAFRGYLPSKTVFGPDALYASIGILGAVIMPHSLYLGSHFATIHRLPSLKTKSLAKEERRKSREIPSSDPSWRSRFRRALSMIDPDLVDNKSSTTTFPERPDALLHRLSIAEMKVQIPHASWDIALSLLIFAIFVNSAILVVAGTAFFYGRQGSEAVGDLYDAFTLLRDALGKVYAILFAIALLAAGQSASITVTLAGQLVSEGFIKWKTNPFVRRLVTRFITIGPSLAVAIAAREALDQTLVASQVALSFALPVVLVPLLLVTALKSKMIVKEDVDVETSSKRQDHHDKVLEETQDSASVSKTDLLSTPGIESPLHVSTAQIPKIPLQVDAPTEPLAIPPSIEMITHDFSSPRYIIALGIIIYLVILLADGYTLITTINPDL